MTTNIGANGADGATGAAGGAGGTGGDGGNGFSDGTYAVIRGGNAGNGGAGSPVTYDDYGMPLPPGIGGNAGAAGSATLTASGTLAQSTYTLWGGNGANGGNAGTGLGYIFPAGSGSGGGAAVATLSGLTSSSDLSLSVAATGGNGGVDGASIGNPSGPRGYSGGNATVSVTNSTVGLRNLSITATPGTAGSAYEVGGASAGITVSNNSFTSSNGLGISLYAYGGAGTAGMTLPPSNGNATISLASNTFQGSGAFTLAITRIAYVPTVLGAHDPSAQDALILDLSAGTLSYGGGTNTIGGFTSYDFSGVQQGLYGNGGGYINETYTVTMTGDGNDNVFAGSLYGANVMSGGDGADHLTGGSQGDTLAGGAGNDFLDGGGGADSMAGGTGNDTYVVDNAGDWAGENVDEGIDTVQSSISYTLADTLENLTLTGSANLNGTGNASNNILIGNAGNNLLNGGSGADAMSGGKGNDTFVIDNTGDTISENANEGADTVRASVSFTLGDHVENLTLTGSDNINGVGNSLDNVLIGNSGNNQLSGLDGNDYIDGGAGADAMAGGTGNDTYVVDNAGDVVTEYANEGIDTVQSSVTYVLADALENLTLTGSDNIDGTGNGLDNVLTGNSGNNQLTGGAGNDTYIVDNAGDHVREKPGEGIDLVLASVSFSLTGQFVENLTLTGSGNINATGNSLDNTLTGNSGNNVLDGGYGNDTYYVDNIGDVVIEGGNGGTDTVYASVSYSLAGQQIENLILTGTANINATGNGLDNTLTGNSGNNVLNGSGGADTMTGGGGNDTYVIDNVGDIVIEVAGQGIDTVQSSISYTLADTLENLSLIGSGNIDGTGNSLDNVLAGNGGSNILTAGIGNDYLNGGAGADKLYGGQGNDTYVVDNANDLVTEYTGEGTDLVRASISYSLTDYVENLTLTGSGNIDGTGNGLDNMLTGNSGNNTLSGDIGNDYLNGAAGADTLYGGQGDDTFVVDNDSDAVFEYTSEGTDLVLSSISYSLTDNVENLTLTGASNLNGTGNALDNIVTGNSGNNILDGGAGADTLSGGVGNDTYYVDNALDHVIEGSGGGTDLIYASVDFSLLGQFIENLTLTGTAVQATGNSLNNLLVGNDGANRLDGGYGADTMQGGPGDDTYVVDNASDVVTENYGEGTDTVQSSIYYVLGANLENLSLTGGSGINGEGNGLNNVLIGNSGNNSLYGYQGNDLLDGGMGVNYLYGGSGDDTYIVRSDQDHVVEYWGEGTDTVKSLIDYVLPDTIENLILTGTAVNATGNSLSNTLTGNSGNNVLDGGQGADTLIGGSGNDTYYVDNTSDVVIEGMNGGTDTIYASVSFSLAGQQIENLTLTGTAYQATGNSLNNILIGNDNSNRLIGGFGNDTLTGGGGADRFSFAAGSGTDVITDFNGAEGDLVNIHPYTQGVEDDTIVSQQGSDTFIDLGNGNSILILNTASSDVTSHIVW